MVSLLRKNVSSVLSNGLILSLENEFSDVIYI